MLCVFLFLFQLPGREPLPSQLYHAARLGESSLGQMARSGDHLFVATWDGFQVFDVATPGVFNDLGAHDTCGAATELLVDGDRLYLADSNGFSVWDVADPAAPTRLFRHVEPGIEYIQRLGMVGGYLLVGPQLRLFDTTTYQEVLDLEINASQFKVVGDWVYLVAEGLYLMDFSDPLVPLTMSLTADSGRRLAVAGDRVYTEGSRLTVFNFNDPFNPVEMGSTAASNRVYRMQVHNGYVISGNQNGADIFDVSDDNNPIISTELRDGGPWYDLMVTGDSALVSRPTQGLALFDVSDPPNPQLQAAGENRTQINAFEQIGDDGMVLTSDGKIQFYELIDAFNPLLLSEIELGFTGLSAVKGAEVVYVAGSFGLYSISLSDTSLRNLLGTNERYDSMVTANQQLFAVGNNRLHVYSLADPMNPVLSAEHSIGISGSPSVAVNDRYYYTIDSEGLRIYDVTTLQAVGSYRLDNCFQMKYIGDYVLVSNGGNHLLDVRDPANVVRYPLPGSGLILGVHEDMMYLGDPFGELTIYDFVDPLNPRLLLETCLPGNIIDLAFSGSRIYALESSGLHILGNGFLVGRLLAQWPEGASILEILPEFDILRSLALD